MSTQITPVVSPVEVVAPPAPKKRGRKPKDPNAEPKPKKTTTKKSKKIIEKTSGEEPAEKTSGEEPAEKTSAEKPAKSKPLSAKHAKFIHFSFFLLEQLNLQGLNIDPELFYNAAHIFDTPDNQTSFIDNFLNNSKTFPNRIKLLLKSKSKPNTKSKSKSKSNNDIVNHLVDLAQNNNDNLEVSEFIHNNIFIWQAFPMHSVQCLMHFLTTLKAFLSLVLFYCKNCIKFYILDEKSIVAVNSNIEMNI